MFQLGPTTADIRQCNFKRDNKYTAFKGVIYKKYKVTLRVIIR